MAKADISDWTPIDDLEKVEELASSKTETFVGSNFPTPPYNEGDFYINGEGIAYVAIRSASEGSPNPTHWEVFSSSEGEHTYWRYSPFEDGRNMTEQPQSNSEYIGRITTAEDKAPTDHTVYIWAKFKGDNGDPGEAATNIICGNESVSLSCTNEGLVKEDITITIPFSGWIGTDRASCICTYGALPSGMTLVSNNAATVSNDGLLAFKVSKGAALNGENGDISLTFICNSLRFPRVFSWSKSLEGDTGEPGKDGKDGQNGKDGEKGDKGDKGEPGEPGKNGADGKDGQNGKDGANGTDARIYEITPSVGAVFLYPDGTFTPSSVVFNSFYRDGNAATRTQYSGRLQIQASANGESWTTIVTATSNSYTITRAISTIIASVPKVKYIKCNLYAAGGTTSLLAVETIEVTNDVQQYIAINAAGLWLNTNSDSSKYDVGTFLHLMSGAIELGEDGIPLLRILGDMINFLQGQGYIKLSNKSPLNENIKGFDMYAAVGRLLNLYGEDGMRIMTSPSSLKNSAAILLDDKKIQLGVGNGSLDTFGEGGYVELDGNSKTFVYNGYNVATDKTPFIKAYNSSAVKISSSFTNIPLNTTADREDDSDYFTRGTQGVTIKKNCLIEFSGAIGLDVSTAGYKLTALIGTTATGNAIAQIYAIFNLTSNQGAVFPATIYRATAGTTLYMAAAYNGATVRTGSNITFLNIRVLKDL